MKWLIKSNFSQNKCQIFLESDLVYLLDDVILLIGVEAEESQLQTVQIYFDTATFDDIERDRKIKVEAQLSLIGGTMGLLTGFSIISGVEIIFFVFRLISSFLPSKTNVLLTIKNIYNKA